MNKIFITGANGMVGRNLKERLESSEFEVLSPSRSDLNILDIAALDEYLKENKPDLIIHCAGLVGGIHANIASPYDFCYQNLQMGINLVESSNNNNIQYLINLGSSCMYPFDAVSPFKEDDILNGHLEPTNEGYAIAKIAVAKMCLFMKQQHNRSYKTLIPCNLYGKYDDFDENKSHMIPGVIRRMQEAKQQGKDSMTIWGSGETRREFMYVEDLADFITEYIDKIDLMPDMMNVGLGTDYSINEYYHAISKVIDYNGIFTHDLTKPEGMKRKQVDVTEQNNMDWYPKHSLLDGLSKTYEYYMEMNI